MARKLHIVVLHETEADAAPAVESLRTAGLDCDAEVFTSDQMPAWKLVKRYVEDGRPPDLLVTVETADGSWTTFGPVARTATTFMPTTPLIVVGSWLRPHSARRYTEEFGAAACLHLEELDRLGEVARQVLSSPPRQERQDQPAGHPDRPASVVLQHAMEPSRYVYALSDRVWLKGADLRLRYANRMFARDMQRTPEELVGKSDVDIWGEEKGRRFQAEDREVLKTGQPVQTGARDGRGLIEKIPVCGPTGQPVALLVVKTRADLYERAQQSLLRWGSFVLSSTDVIVGLSTEGVIESWNPGAESLYGCPAEEMRGCHASRLCVERDRPMLQRLLRQACDTKDTRSMETAARACDGHRFDVSITVSPAFGGWGEMMGLCLVARDITQRVQAEEALKESEERFRLMAETAFDGMSIALEERDTGRQTLVFCNDRYVELCGRSRAELAAASDLRELRSTDATAAVQEHLSAPTEGPGAARQGEGVELEIGSWQRPDGRENYHERSSVRVDSARGRYLFAVDRDITARVHAQRALQDALTELALSHAELEQFAFVPGEREPEPGPYREEIEDVARQVRQSPTRDFDFKEAAQQCHISYGYFRALFRRYMGRPPYDYLLQWRMRRAGRELRTTDRQVKSIALDYGYTNPAHFTRAFKRAMGMAPTDFRRAVSDAQQRLRPE